MYGTFEDVRGRSRTKGTGLSTKDLESRKSPEDCTASSRAPLQKTARARATSRGTGRPLAVVSVAAAAKASNSTVGRSASSTSWASVKSVKASVKGEGSVNGEGQLKGR